MGNREDYVGVRDAMDCIGRKVNLFAVVAEHSIPKKSKGTDFFSTLKIIDSSCQDRGLSVNIFMDDVSKMPNINSDGDIICLHRVAMKIYEGEVFAIFKKNLSTFALFQGKCIESFRPYDVSRKFRYTGFDKEYITQLRTWLADYDCHLDSWVNRFSLQLREINLDKSCDLICRILYVSEDIEGEQVYFVWDGTDVPPLALQTALENEWNNPLPLQLEPLPLSRDVLCTFPRMGTVLRVFDRGFLKQLVGFQSLPIGKWVKFCKMEFQSRSGLWHGVLTPSSRTCLLSGNNKIVKDCQSLYHERESSNLSHLPMSSSPLPSGITETDHDHVPFATLMDVLTSSKVTQKYKCVVRVVAILPWRAKDFRSPIGARVYRIRLTLEDPTARIHAYVYDEDGVKFFNGYPPTDLITYKMNKLLGITERGSNEDGDGNNVDGDNASRNPPWVQCCIKSYYLDKSNPWETRRYRIFDTKLVE